MLPLSSRDRLGDYDNDKGRRLNSARVYNALAGLPSICIILVLFVAYSLFANLMHEEVPVMPVDHPLREQIAFGKVRVNPVAAKPMGGEMRREASVGKVKINEVKLVKPGKGKKPALFANAAISKAAQQKGTKAAAAPSPQNTKAASKPAQAADAVPAPPTPGPEQAYIRGVLMGEQVLYRGKGTPLMFTCKDGSQTISVAQINDDFCDCADGSDEPGTSACSDLDAMHSDLVKFACKQQLTPEDQKLLAEHRGEELPPMLIFTSRVNDGICDCCDGSDEWSDISKPKKGSLAYPNAAAVGPCKNHCGELAAELAKEAALRNQGHILREQYSQKGKGMQERNTYDGGEDNALIPLATRCFEIFDQGYTYKLCPFRSASQKDKGRETSLGKNFKWLSKYDEFELGGGETCPNGVVRATKVKLSCALKDKVVHVTEESPCIYQMFLETPAAC
jgi:hypothetical protein